jgi:predicted thioesterase
MAMRYSPSLKEGIRHTREMQVKNNDLDTFWGIGNQNVLAIPILIAFIEQTCIELITPYLEPNYETMCIEMNLKHLKQVQADAFIHCNVHLKYIDKNNLFFDISVLNQDMEEISHGAHERIIVALK